MFLWMMILCVGSAHVVEGQTDGNINSTEMEIMLRMGKMCKKFNDCKACPKTCDRSCTSIGQEGKCTCQCPVAFCDKRLQHDGCPDGDKYNIKCDAKYGNSCYRDYQTTSCLGETIPCYKHTKSTGKGGGSVTLYDSYFYGKCQNDADCVHHSYKFDVNKCKSYGSTCRLACDIFTFSTNMGKGCTCLCDGTS